jgi:hypothetical protein
MTPSILLRNDCLRVVRLAVVKPAIDVAALLGHAQTTVEAMIEWTYSVFS